MRDEDIHIGDVLRVRQWEDMVNEYGFDEQHKRITGMPSRFIFFTVDMRPLCGRTFTVIKEEVKSYCNRYYSKEDVEGRTRRYFPWTIVSWMLEPFDDSVDFEVATDEEMKLLFC